MNLARLLGIVSLASLASEHDLARAEVTQGRSLSSGPKVTISFGNRRERWEERRRAHAANRRCTWGPNAWKRPAHISAV